MKKKTVYYWSPFITPIATCKAVINSAYSLNKFDKYFKAEIINFFGEFNYNISEIQNKNLNLLNHYNKRFLDFLPKYGKIWSRISYLIIFIFGFIPLTRVLKKNKPEYIIIHLITALPLILLIIFNFETKFILRISGKPNLNIFRKFLWKTALKKIYLVTCPTQETYQYIKRLDICDRKKIKILFDPTINISEIRNSINNKRIEYKNYFVAIGRLTKQKNFLFLCKCFKELAIKYPKINLLILGDGEDFNKLKSYIKKNFLDKNIHLLGYKKNIFPILKYSKGFILSSLWEDPGFVLIEAAFCRVPVFSSDAKPGPYELVKNNVNGITFKSGNQKDFVEKFDFYLNNLDNKKMILENIKICKKFTIFNHYKILSNYLP